MTGRERRPRTNERGGDGDGGEERADGRTGAETDQPAEMAIARGAAVGRGPSPPNGKRRIGSTGPGFEPPPPPHMQKVLRTAR